MLTWRVCGTEVSKWFKTVPSFLVERSWRGVVTRDSVLPAGHGGHIRPEMGTEGQIHVCGGSSCRRHMFTDQRLWRILTSQSRSEKRKRQKAGDLEAEGGRKKEEGCHGEATAQGQRSSPGRQWGRKKARTRRSKVCVTVSRSQDGRREKRDHYRELSSKGRRVWRRFPLIGRPGVRGDHIDRSPSDGVGSREARLVLGWLRTQLLLP